MTEVGTAFVTLAPKAAPGFGKATEKEIGGEITSAGKSTGSKFGTALKLGAGVALGGGALLAGFLKGANAEARDAQKVGALTNAVIKSTGGVANVTAGQVDRLATSISLKTGVDDEAIAAGQNMLLTFSNVRNEVGKGNNIFAQATVAANDMAAAFGGNAVSNSKLLGKALNDPAKGVSALTKVGVSFTQQQKDQIAAMVESGNLLGAQKTILGEVTKQTAGAAEAQATAGEKASVAFGNLQEQVGTALLPLVDKLANTFSGKVVPAVSGFVTQVQTGTGAGGAFRSVVMGIVSGAASLAGFLNQNRTAVAAFGIGLLTLNLAMRAHALSMVIATVGMKGYLLQTKLGAAASRAFAAGQWILNAALTANPIGLVVVALVALGIGLAIAWRKSSTFRAIVLGSFEAVRGVVSSVIGWFGKYVPQVFAFVVGAVKAYIGVYKAVILGAFNVVRGAISGIGRAWNSAVNAVSDFAAGTKRHVSTAIAIVRGIPGQVTSALGNLGSLLLGAGRELIGGLISGVTEKLGDLRSKMGEVGGVIKGFLPGSPVKEGPLRSWNNGGAGKRLVGLLADGLSDTRPVDAAMHRLVSGATLPRSSAGSLALAGVGGGGGSVPFHIDNWDEGTGHFQDQIASVNDLQAERMRAR